MNNHRVILLICYLLVVSILLPLTNEKNVFSPFSSVNPEVNTLIEEIKSSHRMEKSRRFLSGLDPQTTMAYHNARLSSDQVDHIFVIMAKNVDQIKPSRSQYLLPLTTYLHEVVATDNDTGMFLCDCTVNYNPTLQNLTTYFPSYQIEDYASRNKLPNFTNENNRLKLSFLNCLKIASEISNSAKLFTIFNENVLPYQYFARDIKGIINTKLDNKISSGEFVPNDKWLFLHLQEPNELRTFQCDFTSFRELFIIAIIGSLTFHIIFKTIEPQITSSSVLFTFIYGAVFFVTFALSIGRPYISELRRHFCYLYRIYDPPVPVSFSALTLSTKSYQLIGPRLQSITCSDYVGFHQVLDSLINTLEVPGYVVSPSLVRYV